MVAEFQPQQLRTDERSGHGENGPHAEVVVEPNTEGVEDGEEDEDEDGDELGLCWDEACVAGMRSGTRRDNDVDEGEKKKARMVKVRRRKA